MSNQSRYREIEVSGTPREMGRQLGEASREEMRGFCAIALERVNKTVRVSRDAAMAAARDSIQFAEKYAAHMVDELRGMAEGAGLTLDDLMLLQVRNQLQPDKASAAQRAPEASAPGVRDGACTSLALGASALRTSNLVAQNWDSDPALDPYTIVLTRRPAGKPAIMNVTQAGLIGYIGFNEAGIGLCLNTLPAPSRRRGVPHYFTVRGIYEADSLEGAVEAVQRAERVIPANVMLTTPQGPANLEVTVDDIRVLRGEGAGGVSHTNHCRHADFKALSEGFPELIQSHRRQERIELLLKLTEGAQPPCERIEEALRDHEGHPRSICRHTNDDSPTGFWQTVFSAIIEPQAGQMHITRGTPCDHPYETYVLA